MALPETPLTRGEQYLAKAAGQDVAIPNVPLTRVEQYLAKIAGQDVAIPNVPLTRMEQYLDYIAKNGGGSSITVEPLTVTQNGTQTAPSGKAYSPVTVNVPQPSGTKNITISQNGTTTENVESYASASINTDVQPTQVFQKTNTPLSEIMWTGSDFSEIISRMMQYKLFAFLSYDFNGTHVYMPLIVASANDIMGMVFSTDGTLEGTTGVLMNFNSAGNVTAIMLSGGTIQDLSSYAPYVNGTLTVYGTTPISY